MSSKTSTMAKPEESPYSIPESPPTLRKPYVPTKQDLQAVPNPGTPRANIAPTTHSPNGTTNEDWASTHAHQSVLHQHCAFWDPDGDGVVWPQDTYSGFRKIGFGIFLSCVSVFLIHGAFSWASTGGLVPDPLFRLFLKNIHRCRHGSDTGTFDSEGRFVPQRFEDFFVKYGDGEAVTKRQVWEGVCAQRCAADVFGWLAEVFEWAATYLLLWPEDGVLRKEDVRRVYDGSIFPEMARKRAARAKND